MSEETVLIVDDEEMVLTSLSAYLTLETSYEVMTFTSAARALEHLEKHDVGVIISDFLMPEMDGISFLAKAKELRPDAPRVILTGYADKENAIKAIRRLGVRTANQSTPNQAGRLSGHWAGSLPINRGSSP